MAALAAPAVLPIVPLALPAVPHLFVRCAPLGAEPELDYLRVPTGCAVYRAFPTLGWLDVSATFPGHVAAPALVLQYILGAPMHFDWGTAAADAMLRQPELLVMVSLGALARFADAQEGLGVFDKVYRSSQAHLDVLEIALQRCPAPSPFLLGPGELVIHSPFLTAAIPPVVAVAGVAAVAAIVARARVRARGGVAAIPAVVARPATLAVAAVAGRAGVAAGFPAELEWLSLVRTSARVDETSIFPLLAFLRMGAIAPDRCSQLARADPNSLIREVSDSLRAGTLGHSNATTLGNAALTRHFPAFSSVLELLPVALRTHAFDTVVLGRELVDAISFSGDQAKQDAVTAARLHLIGRAYPSAHDFVGRASGVAAKVSAIRALAPLGLGYRAGCSLFECLGTLDSMLLKHASFLTQAWNKLLSVTEVIELLKVEDAEWKAASNASARGAEEGSHSPDASRSAVTLRGVTEAALKRALLEDPRFVALAEECAAHSPTFCPHQPLARSWVSDWRRRRRRAEVAAAAKAAKAGEKAVEKAAAKVAKRGAKTAVT